MTLARCAPWQKRMPCEAPAGSSTLIKLWSVTDWPKPDDIIVP
jgi:hypothetical protein